MYHVVKRTNWVYYHRALWQFLNWTNQWNQVSWLHRLMNYDIWGWLHFPECPLTASVYLLHSAVSYKYSGCREQWWVHAWSEHDRKRFCSWGELVYPAWTDIAVSVLFLHLTSKLMLLQVHHCNWTITFLWCHRKISKWKKLSFLTQCERFYLK